jgi:predicted CoA-substrate-specific enzyme activase
MKATGFCIGASRVGWVTLEKTPRGNIRLIKGLTEEHYGKVQQFFERFLVSNDIASLGRVAVTGRKYKNDVGLTTISEPEAVEVAYNFLSPKYPNCDTILSAGGETFLAYKLDRGRIIDIVTGNKCASGTGEFFLQQINRMDITLFDAMHIADFQNPRKIAGRCSVFCKSDCTHALNKGEPKGQIVAGLCQMMADKIFELAEKCQAQRMLLIGGTSSNDHMVGYLNQMLKGSQQLYVPSEAIYFEALGSALWCLNNETEVINDGRVFWPSSTNKRSFSTLPALSINTGNVVFKECVSGVPRYKDKCIVGLDVGSTTTKAIVMRQEDNAILASVYLRTKGDPVAASQACYKALSKQLAVPVTIVGLGVTGSGRQISGLHAQTDGVINEIIAHATGALYFDPEVDTIFEIGGQDAKYTYISQSVPIDYAMNEACSAGTGSFLEEAAKETLGISTEAIADIALRSTQPLNFSDQCSAFISSDIKTAIQEGLPSEDIVAGLVYSVCQNYMNRVKGNRPVGKKVFMQGGVCYNKAVPTAMATLLGKEIVVPPQPGLMGAFGVALEIRNRLQTGIMQEQMFDLRELSRKEMKCQSTFICNGGSEQCDRKCAISMFEMNSKSYPFGGACNKYANLRKKVAPDTGEDLVTIRESMVFPPHSSQVRIPKERGFRGTVGMVKSLLANSLYPLYSNFFNQLGYDIVLSETPNKEGMKMTGASFCYPVEMSHGLLANLLSQKVDYIFLPHVSGVPVEKGIDSSVTCPLVQGEPYYLKSAFSVLEGKRVLTPVLDFSKGYDSLGKDFISIGSSLGVRAKDSMRAYKTAVESQERYIAESKQLGQKAIETLIQAPSRLGVVIFGRPYNALAKVANMGAPRKFASRGHLVIPWDFLPFEQEKPAPKMYWGMGQMLLKAAKYIKSSDQLFGVFITNFGCGPDAFIIPQLREIMGDKPLLILELDSHTADAGVETRIEAFLDIVQRYRASQNQTTVQSEPQYRQTVGYVASKKYYITDSEGKSHRLNDDSVEIVVPSMGAIASRLLAASFQYAGYNATYLEPATSTDLATGRSNATCKECLPYIIVCGSILNDIAKRQMEDPNKVLVYFMADSSGPCRFGQYHVQIEQCIRQKRIKNVAILTLTSDNGYSGLDSRFFFRAWQAIVISDVMMEAENTLLALAKDKRHAADVMKAASAMVFDAVATMPWRSLRQTLTSVVELFRDIPLVKRKDEVPKVSLLGEIFVRNDEFSRQNLIRWFSDSGIMVKIAPNEEFIYFCDFLLQNSLYHVKLPFAQKAELFLAGIAKRYAERSIKNIFAQSGLIENELINIRHTVGISESLLSPRFTAGESVLTVGSALEQNGKVDGIISIGPFGCLACRVSDAILSSTLRQRSGEDWRSLVPAPSRGNTPYMGLETDGNPHSMLTEAKLEMFSAQVRKHFDNANKSE